MHDIYHTFQLLLSIILEYYLLVQNEKNNCYLIHCLISAGNQLFERINKDANAYSSLF